MRKINKTGKELVITVPDKLGVLSQITTVAANTGVNITAICAYEVDGIAHVRIITDDNQKAKEALVKAGFDAVEHDVLLTEVSPHSIHHEVASLPGDYEVENNYWCASARSGEHALLVFSPIDNVKLASLK